MQHSDLRSTVPAPTSFGLSPGRRSTVSIVWLNGLPNLRIDHDGQLDTALTLFIEGGRVSQILADHAPQRVDS